MSRYMQSEIERLAAAVETLEAKLERAEGQVRAMREDASRALGNAVRERDEAWVAAGTARQEGFAAADAWWREHLASAVAALPQYVITIQDREGYTFERGCEGQPMNYTGVMLADVEALLVAVPDPETDI